MLETWDFVDPKLAKKLHDLHQQIEQLKKKRTLIIQNPRICESSRKNLLTYNDKCLNDLMQLYQIQKNKMTDYFDNQVQVLTKKQVIVSKIEMNNKCLQKSDFENTKINTSVKNIENSNEWEIMNIPLKENQQIQESFQKNNKKRYLKKSKIGESFQNVENSMDNGYKLQYLDTTGRFTNKTMKYERQRAIQSFQLSTTNRNQSYSYQYQNQQSTDFKTTKFHRETYPLNRKSLKAKISHKRYNRLKTRLQNTELQLQLQKLSHKQTASKLKKLKRESNQDKQLIQLLYMKINLIEQQKENIIEQERKRVQDRFQHELLDLRQKYIDLSSLQQKNRELMVKRKEMLKIGNC